jgi:hypothetical protein
MTQPGGPAAINGFLYQIIQHLGWLADVTLTGETGGQELIDACLVLEPRHGGHARAEAKGLFLVEQYKTRPHDTWSWADLESVLRQRIDAEIETADYAARTALIRLASSGLKFRRAIFRS